MNMLQKITVLLVGLAMLIATSNIVNASFDGTITLVNNTSQYSYGTGGEFHADTSGLGEFQTFCIKHTASFYPGVEYNYIIGNNVSIGTAWLYSQFRSGNLNNYNYDMGYNRTLSANKLQQALWWTENQGGERNEYVKLAESVLQMDDVSIRLNANGIYNVVALNLYDNNGTPMQNQLAITPVPEPSTVISGLLLLAPFTLSLFRQKLTV